MYSEVVSADYTKWFYDILKDRDRCKRVRFEMQTLDVEIKEMLQFFAAAEGLQVTVHKHIISADGNVIKYCCFFTNGRNDCTCYWCQLRRKPGNKRELQQILPQ